MRDGCLQGEMDMFEEVVGLARLKVGRDGVAHERDTAPPGSILNANISGFWLTMDLLDVDNTTPAVMHYHYLCRAEGAPTGARPALVLAV